MKKKLFLGLTGLFLFYFYDNKVVKKTHYTLSNDKIPSAFDNFKILHLSDIHCDKVGFSDQIFIDNIKKENPDMIVFTGDILDSYKNDSKTAYNLLAQISSIAKTYFVSGNHELRLKDAYQELQAILKSLEIENLSNAAISISKEKGAINLAGIEDFNYFIYEDKENYFANHKNTLKNLYKKDLFNILLAHRPEKFWIYNEVGYDLIFSGHAHGGQWNLPFLGRIFSPSQGFLPKFTHGIYKDKAASMIVSQGLGNSSFPLRFNNRLEYIMITLKSKKYSISDKIVV